MGEKAKAERLINTPVKLDNQEQLPTLTAVCNHTILDTMLGVGLHRSKVATLTWGHIQQCDEPVFGRW
jgi:hypothetical protein